LTDSVMGNRARRDGASLISVKSPIMSGSLVKMTTPTAQAGLQEEATARPIGKILLGIDLSEQASRIIRTAAYLADSFKADVIVSHVVNVGTGVAGNESDGSPASREERNMLDSLHLLVHQAFGGRGDSVEVKILHGDPAQRLAEYADYSNCDLIVVGSRGQGALRAAFLGSVSNSVVTRSKKPVLVLKYKDFSIP
jgi:nucleotide-binding universal stress UspA family protein